MKPTMEQYVEKYDLFTLEQWNEIIEERDLSMEEYVRKYEER